MQAIEAYNRIAEGNPAMHKVSLEQYMMAIQQAQSMSSFADGSDMESYGAAASSVAQSAATELGYDGEGSASGDRSDVASDVEDAIADADSYAGSNNVRITSATNKRQCELFDGFWEPEAGATQDGYYDGTCWQNEPEPSGDTTSGGTNLDGYLSLIHI